MHTNRLAHAKSPYLLQHAHNPVDWYEWGEEALQRAQDEDRPILVSIGYSSCHWCHVMERESFESEAIASIMNEHFVCIKVDREERPDLDDIYMTAAQALTGSGGWPLNVFLTPDLQPFHGGTYFPPDDRRGRPGFASVLKAVAEVYRSRRGQIEETARNLTRALGQTASSSPSRDLSYRPIELAVEDLTRTYDMQYAGWGGAPKFPSAATIELLLRHHHRTSAAFALRMATATLDAMARGGMRDQLGGGFHRYSMDRKWLIPHFEKMLYDNALLGVAYVDAYQVTGDEEHARVARETLDYVLRDMTDETGGFHSATDADSEGEEGRYFVWDLAEVHEALGAEDAELFAAYYGVAERGNFEGHNILHVPVPFDEFAVQRDLDPADLRTRLDGLRGKLLARREERVAPGKDDKVLADWNGLMVRALARAAEVLGDDRYREAAVRAARFILDAMRPDGHLRHAWRDGDAYLEAYLDDHAFLMQGLIDLYEATFDPAWVRYAREIADEMIARYWDEADGGFFFTTADRPDLIARPKRTYDGPTPSGNAMAAMALLKLSRLTGDASYGDRAEATLKALAGQAARAPRAFPALLCAIDSALASPSEVAVVGPPDEPATRALIAAARKPYRPDGLVVAFAPEAANAVSGIIPLAQGKAPLNGQAAAYVCDERGCRPPVASAEELVAALSAQT